MNGFADARSPATVGAVSDTVGVGSLSERERDGWHRALAYYRRTRAASDISVDSRLIATNYALSGVGDQALRPGEGLPPELIGALEDASPAYRRLWWPSQARANREFVARMSVLLAQHGNEMASALVRLYRVPWSTHPVPVEVVAYANWAGAYTTVEPTLITISSTYRGTAGTLGLDLLFHEASHGMMDSVGVYLTRLGMKPRSAELHDLEHAIIFFTAGEVLRQSDPDAVAYYEWRGVFAQGTGFLTAYYPALRSAWVPYMAGHGTLYDALAKLVLGSRTSSK